MTLRPLVVALALVLTAGCTLFTSLDGLSDPAPSTTSDAGDAGSTTEAEGGAPKKDGGPVDPNACVCPEGTQETNGVCVVVPPSAAGNTCVQPIVAPACALTYEAELCASHTPFPYATQCGGKGRPSVFFKLGPLPGTVPDGGMRRWLVKSTNTEVLSRTNAACTQGIEPCAQGPGPGGELTPGGATVAWGKAVASGCATVRIDIEPY